MSNVSEVRHILVIADQKSRRIVPLAQSNYSIGRDPNSSILLYDRQVSRHHATLLRINDVQNEQPCYRIVDGNLQGKRSTNGITINGKYCLSHELQPGDLVRFGSKSQANYYVIANSEELDLLKQGNNLGNKTSESNHLDTFLNDHTIMPLEELFIEDEEENQETMRFGKVCQTNKPSHQIDLSSLIDSNPYPIIEINFPEKITYINPTAKVKFPDLNEVKLDHPILQGLVLNSSGKDETYLVREVKVDEDYYEQHIYYAKDNNSLMTYLFDITKYKQREEKLRASKDRYRLFLEQGTEGILLVDRQSKNIIEANQAYCKLLGYSSAEIIGLSLYELIALEREVIKQELVLVTAEKPYIIKESLHRHRNGSLISVAGKISETLYQGQEVFCLVIRDILERKQAEEKLKYQSLHDPLTNLPNRLLLNKQLAIALAHAQRHQHLLAVIFLDIDSFTHINNTLGHTIGDRVLQSFGKRLESCVRTGDTVSRWGSDEFTLLLPQISNTEDTIKLAQRIFDNLQRPFIIEEHQLKIKCSIGIAVYPQDGENSEILLKNADAAMNRTKEQGRNHYQFYSPNLTDESSLLLRIESLLHQAIEKKQFYLHYQPQISLATGKIVGMEALLRWQHPSLGVIPPQKFIPLAEKTDLMLHINKWVLKTACAQNRSWQKDGLPSIPIAVNLCSREFQQPNLAEIVARVLDETALDPQWLELEVTELTLRQHLNLARKTLKDLQNLGVRIALDDFGRGFSSLGYLKQFSFRTLKIDQEFIRDFRGTSEEMGLISAVLAIGRGFNIRVVAEGVETPEQLQLLREIDCQEVQGYLFSYPLSAKEATEFLGKMAREP
ncbi:EAL domain-containing protein [Aphanothece sacrum]|uniref:Diguanylate cyclase n=1 Tax=Aphanothece sacrum FPU1 TaxID=1920663 RepID=A0A401IEH1_APHSA|nr:EAL domain-containing protein [Aphanothece sacrum]GBF79631.1 diguanylate cyclase [Aphanothece sacrum FPU1]GBF87091.1 diguanylate cyclase [Aphanothece sacrum FPU3]